MESQSRNLRVFESYRHDLSLGLTIGCHFRVDGEGQLDSQNWGGKVVGYVSSLAHTLNKPIGYCVGSAAIEFPKDAFAAVALATLAGSKEAAMESPKAWVLRTGKEMASAISRIL